MGEAEHPGIADLERRVAALEQALARLTAGQPSAAPPRPRVTASATPAPVVAAPKAQPIAPRPIDRPAEIDLEQWVGQRGLLIIGVVALLVATAFFMKYAFDRGWVPPVVRILGGVAAGIATMVIGERQVRRGLRRYGLAIVGAGGGIVYLSIWAA